MFACVYLLKARIKKVVPVKSIKKFVASKHMPNQKYRLRDEKFLEEECIILFLADTEDKLQQMMEGTRDRKPTMKVLVSAGEKTETEPEELENVASDLNKKRKAEGNHVESFLKKRLEKLRGKHFNTQELENVPASVPESLQTERSPLKSIENEESDAKTQECNKCKYLGKTVASLRNTNVSLSQEVRDLKRKLEESNSSKVIIQAENERKDTELKTLRELNVVWQKTAIEKHNNLLAIHKATMEAPSTSQGGGQFPAVGYITEDESQIHIGRGLYLSMQAWSLALNVPNTRKVTFAKNILVALCGYDYLSKTTISGRGSNRNGQTKKPEEQLDPKILLAVRDIFSYYLVNEKKYSATAADVEAGKVHAHISKKIAQIKDVKKKAYARKPERKVMGESSSTSEIAQSIEDDVEVDMGNGVRISLSSLSDNLLQSENGADDTDDQEHLDVSDTLVGNTQYNFEEVNVVDPLVLSEKDKEILGILNAPEEEIIGGGL